jgi:hypothetical protein
LIPKVAPSGCAVPGIAFAALLRKYIAAIHDMPLDRGMVRLRDMFMLKGHTVPSRFSYGVTRRGEVMTRPAGGVRSIADGESGTRAWALRSNRVEDPRVDDLKTGRP